ncbi:MAG TPA: biopolymer transporter ExbD [Ginsengibacter sp.]
MAQIEQDRRSKSKKHPSRKLIRVDLTPMVDLGFLLITFFILTATLSDPTIANLLLPKDSVVKTPVKQNTVLTLLLTRNDSIKYFEGADQNNTSSKYCTFQNLRSVIQEKQKKVAAMLGSRLETVLIIYPEGQSTYKNFIDVLDEIQINDIRHYFVMNSQY